MAVRPKDAGQLKHFQIAREEAETEIRRERGSIAPWKVFARPESFAQGTYFFYIITKTCLESLRIVWKCFNIMGKESGLCGKFPD